MSDGLAPEPAGGLFESVVPSTGAEQPSGTSPAGSPTPGELPTGPTTGAPGVDEGEDAGRPGRLVEAPHVEPSGAIVSEIRRRTQPG